MATVQWELIGGLRTATVHGFPINNEEPRREYKY